MKRIDRELQRFISTEVKRTLDKVNIMSPEQILFGCMKVDIHVPPEKFSEMNTSISRDDIGENMKAYEEQHNIMAQP